MVVQGVLVLLSIEAFLEIDTFFNYWVQNFNITSLSCNCNMIS